MSELDYTTILVGETIYINQIHKSFTLFSTLVRPGEVAVKLVVSNVCIIVELCHASSS